MKILLLSLILFTSNYNNNRFANTNWVTKASNRYSESINLRGNNYSVHFNKKLDYTYQGWYKISKDTLVIMERDCSHGQKAAYHRIKFLFKNNMLHPCSREELVNHQWAKSKVGVEKNYVFKKV